ncbi:hypothetical protein TKK_0003029 [Trichogramma kaykai]
MGVKNETVLSHLPYFNIVRGFVPDSLHCIFLGICRQFAKYWFDQAGEEFYLGPENAKKIEKILGRIKAPNQVVRLTRSLKDKRYWKSRECENWLLYYSLPILKSIENFQKYSDHWKLLVNVCHTLLQQSITRDQLQEANEKLENFVILTEKYYSKNAMSYNIHQMLHLVQSVIDWGPLWAHHGYPFENSNGEISRSAKSAKGVLFQIGRSLNFKRCINEIECHLQKTQPERLQFCNSLDKKFTGKSYKISHLSACRYFGRATETEDKWINQLHLFRESALSYTRMVKDNCLYSTRNNLRSNNSYAKLIDDTFIIIEKFIVDSITQQEYTICRVLHTDNDGCNKKIILEAEISSAVLTSSIACIAVYIEINENKYVTSVPNMLHY